MKPIIIQSHATETVLQCLDTIADGEYIVNDDAVVTVVVYATGNKDISGTIHVRLVGQRSTANIIGVFMIGKEHRVSLHTLQHHQAKDTRSNLLVKSVLNDSAQFSYDGAIRVEHEGQKTDAYQRNENLMLSDRAQAQSKPSLEILADDVRCTHGATVGNINQEQLFYMKSRGINEQSGIQLIVEGFLNDALGNIHNSVLEEQVKGVLWQTLQK